MANALAIATVTETLRQTLTKALPGALAGQSVTVLRPDASTGLPNPGVNVFLYQATPNPAWRNADLPTRRADQTLLRRPQVALDLYYLLTFYGDDSALEPQRLFGAVARALHAQPALNRADLKAVEATLDASGHKYLDSHISEQIDLVRFTPIHFSLEEMSKLWSVFLKTDYVLSAAYMASVVLIETDDLPPASPLPVLEARIDAVPLSLAVIESIDPQYVDELAPPAATTITLSGQSLDGAGAAAFTSPGIAEPLDGVIVGPGAGPGQLRVELPPGLHPGVNTIALIWFLPGESPGAAPRVLSQSNTAAFVLRPTPLNLDSSTPGKIIAVVRPSAGPDQKIALVLNQLAASPPQAPQAFELAAAPHPAETDTFAFDTTFTPQGATTAVALPPGAYLARVRIDGAESRLQPGPAGGFGGPTVTL